MDPLTKDGMKHQGTKGAGTLLDVDGEGHPTVSDGCLVLVATCVKCDVFVWTADSLLHIHNWRMGKLRARRCSVGSTPNLPGHMGPLFKL
jgi:hypothetical protein